MYFIMFFALRSEIIPRGILIYPPTLKTDFSDFKIR